MMKMSFLFKSDYIEKRSLFESIKKLTDSYSFQGKLLDIGCGNKPYKNLFKKCDYIGIDYEKYSENKSFHYEKPDIFFLNEYKQNFKMSNIMNKSFDVVVSFQVLEHHKKPDIFFSECSRILKSGGLLMITTPFVWGLHEEPNDYYRYTEYIIKNFCDSNSLELIEIIKRKGLFCVINQMLNNSLLSNKSILYKIMILPMIFMQPISYFLDCLIKEKKIFLGYTFLIRKPFK